MHNADWLAVHADEERVGMALRHGGDVRPLAAAEVEVHALKAPVPAWDERETGLGPTAPVRLGARLDGVGCALDALVEDEVLGHTCMHGEWVSCCVGVRAGGERRAPRAGARGRGARAQSARTRLG